MSGEGSTARPIASVLLLLAAALLISAFWNLPVKRDEFGWTMSPFALEIVLVLLVVALVPRLRHGGPGRAVALVVAMATTIVALLKASDLVMQEVLGRPLNPVLDVRLLRAVSDLLTGMFGDIPGWIASAALLLFPLLLGAGVYALARRAQRALSDPLARKAMLGMGAVLLAFFVAGGPLVARSPIVANDASRALIRYAHAAQETARGIADVRVRVARDPFQHVPPNLLLERLQGVDVILLFVESYGRSALELPPYAARMGSTMADIERRLAARGLSSVSGWLTSPTVGGQSWLANGTFTSGLWLPDQGSYDAAIQSTRLTLARAFGRAGYRTVALKPAVIRPWPEGASLGFSRMYVAADLGYAGKPYNWITMPDQYTLSALQRLERSAPAGPLFAEVSLLSSHTPWTPVPPVLDWATIGDGRVFSKWADEGPWPDDVWTDVTLMRQQYELAIDYVLRVVGSYADTFLDARTLLLVVGDHQPSPLVTNGDAGADVPMHVISGDPRLLAPFEAWGFTPGMQPAPSQPPKRMDTFRDFFFGAFGAEPTSGF